MKIEEEFWYEVNKTKNSFDLAPVIIAILADNKELKEKKNRYLRDEVLPKLPKKQQLEAARKLMDDNFNSKKKPKLSTSKQLD